MKFDQLIEHNMKKIFLEKPNTKCGGDTIPRPFYKMFKIQDISIVLKVWNNSLKNFIHLVFILCQVENYQNMLKLSCRSLTITSHKALLKDKKKPGNSLTASFSA